MIFTVRKWWWRRRCQEAFPSTKKEQPTQQWFIEYFKMCFSLALVTPVFFSLYTKQDGRHSACLNDKMVFSPVFFFFLNIGSATRPTSMCINSLLAADSHINGRNTVIFKHANATPIPSIKCSANGIIAFSFFFGASLPSFSIITFSFNWIIFTWVRHENVVWVCVDDHRWAWPIPPNQCMQNQSILFQSFIKFNYMVFGSLRSSNLRTHYGVSLPKELKNELNHFVQWNIQSVCLVCVCVRMCNMKWSLSVNQS